MTRYTFFLSLYTIFVFVVEICSVCNKYGYSFIDAIQYSSSDRLLFVLLCAPLTSLFLSGDLDLNKFIKTIMIWGLVAYAIRFYISAVYGVTGNVVFQYIASEYATDNWIRNGTLRLNPPFIAVIAVPLGYYYYKNVAMRNKEKILALSFIIVSIAYTVLIHMSRSLLVYQIAVLMIMLVYRKQESQKRIITVFIIAIVLVIGINVPAVQNFFDSFSISGSEARSTTKRLETLVVYFSAWKNNLLLGFGPMEYEHLHATYYLSRSSTAALSDIGIFGFVCKYGVLGLSYYIVIFGRFLGTAIKAVSADSEYRALAVGIAVSYLLFGINIDSFTIGIISFSMPISIAIMEMIRKNIDEENLYEIENSN